MDMIGETALNSWRLYPVVTAGLLGLAATASANDGKRPLPVEQRMVHTCDRQHCFNVPGDAVRRPTAPAQSMKVAPVGGQRIALTLDGAPDCFSTNVDLTTTSWNTGDHVTYLSQSSIPVPLGTTHTYLTYTATTFVNPSGAVPASYDDGGNIYTVVRLRRTGSGETGWWIAGNAPSNPVSSTLDNQYFWSNVSLSTLVDLSGLPGGSGVPSGVDVDVRHYVVQDEGFATESLVCNGELVITL
jgi:hypothetical protein